MGILEDDLEPAPQRPHAALAQVGDFAALELDRAFARRTRPRACAPAWSSRPDSPTSAEHLSAPQLEADPVHSLHRPRLVAAQSTRKGAAQREPGLQVVDFEQRPVGRRSSRLLSNGDSSSRFSGGCPRGRPVRARSVQPARHPVAGMAARPSGPPVSERTSIGSSLGADPHRVRAPRMKAACARRVDQVRRRPRYVAAARWSRGRSSSAGAPACTDVPAGRTPGGPSPSSTICPAYMTATRLHARRRSRGCG